jgi:DNA-binding MarR family transcriptional regulator
VSEADPLAGFDPAFHPPVRLRVCAVLTNVSEAEFAKLRDLAGVADSVMSKHLSALAEVGYLSLRKAALDGRQRTWVRITSKGRTAFVEHVAALRRLAEGAPS